MHTTAYAEFLDEIAIALLGLQVLISLTNEQSQKGR